MPGIFISRGVRLVIPPGGLVLSLTRPTPLVTVHVHFDVCPSWCQIALQHLKDAQRRAAERIEAWAHDDQQARGATLEREFEAAMQAIVAAGIAIDAFYAAVQPHVAIPPAMLKSWREGRTARHAQIAEVLRRAFRVSPIGFANLKVHLKELFRFRDLAVHPSGKLQAPLLHPELDVGVEWRFAFFRAPNAEAVVHSSTGIIWQLVHSPRPTDARVKEYAVSLRDRLTELFPNGHPSVPVPESEA